MLGTFGLDDGHGQGGCHEEQGEGVVELHPAAAGKEGLLERDEEVGGEGHVIAHRQQLQQDVDGEVDLAEVGLAGLLHPEEHQEVEDAADVDQVLELVDVEPDQDHVVVGQGLQQRDDGDQLGRVLAALTLDVVQGRQQQADLVNGGVLMEETTARLAKVIWTAGLKNYWGPGSGSDRVCIGLLLLS